MRKPIVLSSIILTAGTLSFAFVGPASSAPAVCVPPSSSNAVCIEHNTTVDNISSTGIDVLLSPIGDLFIGVQQGGASSPAGSFSLWNVQAVAGGKVGLIVGQNTSTGPTGTFTDTRAIAGLPVSTGGLGVEQLVGPGTACALTLLLTTLQCPGGSAIPYINVPALP